MINKMKRIAAIHDIAGFGRAALSNIIPTVSAMGIQVCPVPTAVLSSHLGGLGKPAIVDLTQFMNDTAEHWHNLDLKFDCIYSGFLSSSLQAEAVLKFFDYFKKESTLIAVDPAMADGGRFYTGMGNEMALTMKKLIAHSDIIFPNYTEGCFLLDEAYCENRTLSQLKAMMEKLSDLGAEKVVMTSIPSENKNSVIVLSYDSIRDEYFKFETPLLGGSFPGTGDIFASVVIGSLLNGKSMEQSICHSMNYVSRCIKYTMQFDEPAKFGVMFEPNLHLLSDYSNDMGCERI